jgi:hypothetical protein
MTEPMPALAQEKVQPFAGAFRVFRESLEAQFKAGLDAFEAGFGLTAARDLIELSDRVAKSWQECVRCLQRATETQLQAGRLAAAWGRQVVGASPEGAPARRRPAGPMPVPDGRPAAGTVRGPRTELEELKEAFDELEMTRGDWAKSR